MAAWSLHRFDLMTHLGRTRLALLSTTSLVVRLIVLPKLVVYGASKSIQLNG